MKKILLATAICLLSASVCASGLKIESIQINHRPASELLSIIEPLLSESGTVQSYNNQIILKETADNIQQLKALIAQLDQKPELLMITVSQGREKPSERFTIDEQGQVEFYDHKPGHKEVYQTSREDNRTIHHLKMNSGETAYVESGMSIPIVMHDSYITDQWAQHAHSQQHEDKTKDQIEATLPAQPNTTIQSPRTFSPTSTTSFILSIPPATNALINAPPTFGADISVNVESQREHEEKSNVYEAQGLMKGSSQALDQKLLRSGVYITPTLLSQEVRLHVLTIDERPHKHYKNKAARDKPSFAYEKMETTLVVPMGQWTYLGGNQKETERTQKGYYSTRDRREDKSHIWVRVDKVKQRP